MEGYTKICEILPGNAVWDGENIKPIDDIDIDDIDIDDIDIDDIDIDDIDIDDMAVSSVAKCRKERQHNKGELLEELDKLADKACEQNLELEKQIHELEEKKHKLEEQFNASSDAWDSYNSNNPWGCEQEQKYMQELREYISKIDNELQILRDR